MTYVERLACLVFWVWVLSGSIWLASTLVPFGLDNTDTEHERSGLRLYTDHGTGCQYVGRFFSLVPRLNHEGRPMCGDRQ